MSLPGGNAAELGSVVQSSEMTPAGRARNVQSPWATPSDSWLRGLDHVRVTMCRVVNLAWWEDSRHAANNKGLVGNKTVPLKGVAIVSPCLGESGRSSRGSRDSSHRQLGPSAILIGARNQRVQNGGGIKPRNTKRAALA